MAAEGKTNTEIGERLEMSRKAVGRWRKRFCEQGIEGIEDLKRTGRPRRFPPGGDRPGQGGRLRPPAHSGRPLSRFSRAELHRLVIERGFTAASAATIARWLDEDSMRQDSMRPWQHRFWIFPTGPDFPEKAGPVLDLYQGRREGSCCTPATS